jgi:glycosyltransferase involved in cell wall biosynthesis
MSLYLYSHDAALAKKTGITKVGFQIFKSLNLNKIKFTFLSHATRNSILLEFDGVINSNIKFILLNYRTYVVKNKLKKAVMLFVNLFRYSLKSSNFNNNDIILFNHFEYIPEFSSFLKTCKSKKVAWIHGTPNGILSEPKVAKKINFIVDLYNSVDIVVHLNKTSLDSWKSYGMKTRGVIINNTIEVKEPTIQIENIDVLLIGTINERKGFGYLLEQLDLLENINFNINIIGKSQGNFADMFTQKIEEHQNINYLGLVSDPENYISSAKLVWCLSKGEGQSLAMLESLEKGKPIISTNYQAAEDLVINNKNGYLIEDELITSFIKHTEELLSDEKKYVSFSNFSKELFKSKLSNEIFNKNINKLIKDVTTNS